MTVTVPRVLDACTCDIPFYSLHARTTPNKTIDLRRTVAQASYKGESSLKFYELSKVLGKGSFGQVRLAVHKLTGKKVAVKIYDKSKFQSDPVGVPG